MPGASERRDTLADTWIRAAARRGVLFQPLRPDQRFVYKHVVEQLEEISDDIRIIDLMAAGTLAPILLALASFDARVDPPPARFGRHATAHAAGPEQYTEVNAVISVMLATSLLRQAEAGGW
jgi:hypothetical protein